MEIFYIVVAVIAVALVALTLISEFANAVVWKGLVSEKKLDAFFSEHLEKYRECGMNAEGDMFYGLSEHPTVYVGGFSPVSKWVFGRKCGRIPRWSKWHKVLNELQKELAGKPGIEKYL